MDIYEIDALLFLIGCFPSRLVLASFTKTNYTSSFARARTTHYL
jgi:hypothetical protein